MQAIPWHRPGQPEEIARVVLFLASDDGDYVTGQTSGLFNAAGSAMLSPLRYTCDAK